MNVFAIRHGETAWSISGQHTGTTDIPLTDKGRKLAERMRSVLAAKAFSLVLCSPMHRTRETCELAGLGDKAVIDPDLVEWNYGQYEGLTPQQIQEMAPGWLIFRDGLLRDNLDEKGSDSRSVKRRPVARSRLYQLACLASFFCCHF